MTDCPVAKKFRIWNPAISSSELSENQDEPLKNLQTQDEESPDDKPLDCTSKNSQVPFPEIFQNYLQLAPLMLRLQHQRQMEDLARRQFLSSLCHVASPIAPVMVPPPAAINSVGSTGSATSSSSSSTSSTSSSTSSASSSSSSSTTGPMNNPLVATALGNPLVNENCCAVCGAVFRLTGDLVQHMRNNHRKSKFKRKADSRQ